MLDIHLEEKKEQRQPPRTSIQSGSLDQRKAPVRGFSRSTSLNRLLAITGDYQIANPLLSVKGETEYLQDAELFEKDYVQVHVPIRRSGSLGKGSSSIILGHLQTNHRYE